MWGNSNETNENAQNSNPNPSPNPNSVVDAAKAPGYRATAGCSPVSHSSRTSSHSTSPPGPLPSHLYSNFSDMSTGIIKFLIILRYLRFNINIIKYI